VTSTKTPNVVTEPKRLLVVKAMRGGPNLRTADFERWFAAALGTCGAVMESRSTPLPRIAPVTLDDGAAADQIQRFQPDALLTVAGLRQTYRRFSGSVIDATYAMSLSDMASRKELWSAEIKVVIGDRDGGKTLADLLIGRLREDGILGSCAGVSDAAQG
jgi:hypothetical protein